MISDDPNIKTRRAKGQILWFDYSKGYGFIKLASHYFGALAPALTCSLLRIVQESTSGGARAAQPKKQQDIFVHKDAVQASGACATSV